MDFPDPLDDFPFEPHPPNSRGSTRFSSPLGSWEHDALLFLIPTRLECSSLLPTFRKEPTGCGDLFVLYPRSPRPLRVQEMRKMPLSHQGQEEFLLHICGVGPFNAGRSTAELLNRLRPREMLMMGICGALDPSLRAGDLVISQDALAWESYRHVPPLPETDRRLSILTPPQLPGGHICEPRFPSRVHGEEFPRHPGETSDASARSTLLERSVRACLRAGLTYRTGRLLTVRQPVFDRRHRRSWKETTGACAVVMEDYPVARLAERSGVPFLSVRAVSDPADWDAPGLERWVEDLSRGKSRANLLNEFLRLRPAAIPPLARLVLGTSAALWSLMRFASAFLRESPPGLRWRDM